MLLLPVCTTDMFTYYNKLFIIDNYKTFKQKYTFGNLKVVV